MERYTRRGAIALGASALLAGCAQGKFISYDGPEISRVVVRKSTRQMYLINGQTALRVLPVQFGFTSTGPKQFEGDGRTPEGRYCIDRRNPNSAFYLSVGIDYPNDQDRAFAAAHGRSPGGDIFIHGWGKQKRDARKDWTAGCVAVTNDEMREVYAMVRNGTQIDIYA
ncbi:L,D-transpeptidase catalytic domain [Jannaschia seosinensis]|uniref:L,D-transpeptidase catalytic domain n=1 Tax=Jannaschia seosinensis TaxID=313367 RepID=A0A0M7BAG3_9RHOB|nr:L,D-transpeptidase family protein [Jannaschia seosinensis]CUH38923.1 L,D-transpeptidase catalytic domain [Jannaschia seosinensis]